MSESEMQARGLGVATPETARGLGRRGRIVVRDWSSLRPLRRRLREVKGALMPMAALALLLQATPAVAAPAMNTYADPCGEAAVCLAYQGAGFSDNPKDVEVSIWENGSRRLHKTYSTSSTHPSGHYEYGCEVGEVWTIQVDVYEPFGSDHGSENSVTCGDPLPGCRAAGASDSCDTPYCDATSNLAVEPAGVLAAVDGIINRYDCA